MSRATPLTALRAAGLILSVEMVSLGQSLGASGEFLAREKALTHAINEAHATPLPLGDRVGAQLALARFYVSEGLHAEALAAIGEPDLRGASVEALILAAEQSAAMARWRRVIEISDGYETIELLRLRAIALSKLGDDRTAASIFGQLAPTLPADHFLAHDERLARARAALATNDAGTAADLFGQATVAGFPPARDAERRLILAHVKRGSGDVAAAREDYRRLATLAPEAIAAEAQISLLELDCQARANCLADAEKLLLQWRGGAAERRIRLFAGGAAIEAQSTKRAFMILRGLIDHHAESEEAAEARAILSKAMTRLFADNSDLGPVEAAALFRDNLDLAPPGRAGDALIREAALRLSSLGLSAEAATLLEHQVFYRLRGEERARVAIDLAKTHLEAQAPQSALEAIRSTRIAGLNADDAKARLALEARALAALGRIDEALELVTGAPEDEADLMRAEFFWTAGVWSQAAAAYARIPQSTISENDLSVARTAILRAGAAYLLADDVDGFSVFEASIAARFEGAAHLKLLQALGALGDSEISEARVMEAYRVAFSQRGES